MEILAIIPARGGSKGIPDKNLKLLNGKPLLAYPIIASKKSSFINRVIVSTDSEKIAECAVLWGAEVPFLRPAHLADDSSSTVDAILHAVEILEYKENYIPDYICVLQCTSPLTGVSDIDGAFKKLLKLNMDGIVTVCECETHPYWSQIFQGDRLEYLIAEGKNITRRQDLPKTYRINGAAYILKRDILLKERTLEPEKLTGYIMDSKNSIDIDNSFDFMLAELIMKEQEAECAK